MLRKYYTVCNFEKRMDEEVKNIRKATVDDDGAVKGIPVADQEIKKLFVEPVLQGNLIGSVLLQYRFERK